MIITNISRVFFSWDEFEEMQKFKEVAERNGYRIVGEDTCGTRFEQKMNFVVDSKGERKEE